MCVFPLKGEKKYLTSDYLDNDSFGWGWDSFGLVRFLLDVDLRIVNLRGRLQGALNLPLPDPLRRS